VADDFWRRAQEGERDFWLREQARGGEFAAKDRRAFWQGYLDFLRRHRPLRPGDRVLDLGCGPTGCITAVEDFCQRYGVDPLAGFYREHYPLPPGIEFSEQTGEELSFPDGFFQVALCINALDHTRDPAAVLRQLHRVLEPGGWLLLDVHTFQGLEFWRKRLRRGFRILRGRPEKHPHTFRPSDVLRAAARAGFAVVEREPYKQGRRDALRLLLRSEPVVRG